MVFVISEQKQTLKALSEQKQNLKPENLE